MARRCFFIFAIILMLPSCYAISITYEPSYPTTSTSVHFTANVGNITPVVYSWNLGDGTHELGDSIYHRYADDGNYTVTLTVITDNSTVYQCNVTVYVNNTNPVAEFTWNIKTPNPFDAIKFTDKSYDTDGEIVAWHWDFGDGGTSSYNEVTHAFIDEGIYNVTLTVTDNDGGNSTVTKKITVRNNKNPDAVFVVNSNVIKKGEQITFIDSSTDPDGIVVNWSWDFGDGSISYERQPVHIYKSVGEYQVILTVTDDDGASSSFTSIIKVESNGNSIPSFSFTMMVVAMLAIVVVSHRFKYKPRI